MTAITLRPAASRYLSPRPLVGFDRRRAGPSAAAAQNLRRALLTPLYESRGRRPMNRRDISITTGMAVLAMQVAFLVALRGP